MVDRYRWPLAGLFFSCTLSAAHGAWEQARYDSAASDSHHVSVTGTAEGWHGSHGHPKLRVSCDTASGGGDIYLGFHFPGEHDYLQQISRNEPVNFRVSGIDHGGVVKETIEYLSVPASESSVLRTLLASDGMASSGQSGKLLLDLHYGQYLDVQFIQHPQSYRVQYNLAGFAETVREVMQSCQMLGFAYADLGNTWHDYISIVEVAGTLVVQPLRFGAAQRTLEDAEK